MKVENLPEVEFIKVNSDETLAKLITDYQTITERSLAKGDPVRLFLMAVAEEIVRLKNEINYAGKMNLLKYAEGDFLDHLGVFTDTERLEADAAITTVKITLSSVRGKDTVIPKGARISNGDKLYFAITEDAIIPAGEIETTAKAECLETGEIGNDYLAGELNTIVDPVPYVQSIINTTKTEGGSDVEKDDHYRERISEAPEKFSNAGSVGAYRYWALSASALITDARPMSPSKGVVNVYILLQDGELPGDEMREKVYETLSADKTRPLTDYVQVLAPEVVEYNLRANYYIYKDADATATQKAVKEAANKYALWQKAKLGRDINPTELISYIKSVSGVKRVEVIAPNFVFLTESQVAVNTEIAVVMMGREDE